MLPSLGASVPSSSLPPEARLHPTADCFCASRPQAVAASRLWMQGKDEVLAAAEAALEAAKRETAR